MNYSYIDSKDNQLIKFATKLGKDAKFRHEQHKAVIYGRHLVEEAIKFAIIDIIFISQDKLEVYSDLVEKIDPTVIYLISANIFNKFELSDSNIDIVAIINFTQSHITENVYTSDCIVLEKIQDPGNLGTILRVACASNIKNVVLSQHCVDAYNPKVLRASQGIQFAINIIFDVDLHDFASKYKGNLIATTPHGGLDLYQVDLKTNVAMFFGNEGAGLSRELLSQINNVRIPMLGNSESLNLAMAVTICAFEMVRQRYK